MNDPAGSESGDAVLQFDQAEYVAPEVHPCAACGAPIREQYFGISGKSFCTQCHDKLRAAQGTPASRFLAALGWGGGAAILGAAIYYGIRAATGYELGLVAIVVGVLV